MSVASYHYSNLRVVLGAWLDAAALVQLVSLEVHGGECVASHRTEFVVIELTLQVSTRLDEPALHSIKSDSLLLVLL